jgi:hypothetical protein
MKNTALVGDESSFHAQENLMEMKLQRLRCQPLARHGERSEAIHCTDAENVTWIAASLRSSQRRATSP